ncbi:hypothetical protein [Flavobacterium lindanitolerans]|uniref:hypothetical protein n=1 Tax=Flavobacterium lindanitolerans TaxID=428988 RepID=UPI002807763D|nr:hypothetical protein [Flavobacterium lindanitolerans]MDQ7960193.1 hypothetical protein [Flavobacterium lindanitolerans]
MKKIKWIILFAISFILCVLFYIKYDSKGYEYGLGCNYCNKKMPYHLTPYDERDGSRFSFTLKDEDDFELVGTGFRYQTTNFEIKNLLAYGYNNTSVIVKCTDSLNTVRYLISFETGYTSKKGNPEISFKDLSINDFQKVKDKYNWFEIDKEKGYAIDRNKFLFVLGALLSLVFGLLGLFKLKNK